MRIDSNSKARVALRLIEVCSQYSSDNSNRREVLREPQKYHIYVRQALLINVTVVLVCLWPTGNKGLSSTLCGGRRNDCMLIDCDILKVYIKLNSNFSPYYTFAFKVWFQNYCTLFMVSSEGRLPSSSLGISSVLPMKVPPNNFNVNLS